MLGKGNDSLPWERAVLPMLPSNVLTGTDGAEAQGYDPKSKVLAGMQGTSSSKMTQTPDVKHARTSSSSPSQTLNSHSFTAVSIELKAFLNAPVLRKLGNTAAMEQNSCTSSSSLAADLNPTTLFHSHRPAVSMLSSSHQHA